MKDLIKILFALVIIIMASSCSKDNTDDINDQYTPEKEKELLGEYLDYLIEEGYDIDTTENGVYYVVIEEGDSIYPQEGDELHVKYTGFFLGGIVFDSFGDTATNSYYKYEHLVDRMVPGWEEGIETIKKGGNTLLIVPSEFGYGANGVYPSIPPYTTLLFDI